MKRCPECRRDYYDDTLNFCLDDGSVLLDGPAIEIVTLEPETAVFQVPDEPATLRFSAAPLSLTFANSIAVLPFANISADEENEYFCDGLSEELLNALSRVGGLKVAARTSAFSFKGKNADAREIGEKLRVGKILEGSVRRSGERLRISVQLVDAENGYHLWSERYDREMRDIFEIQDEITIAVVDALKLELLGDEKASVLKKGTDKPGAYELYLRGLFYLNKRTTAGFERAIEYFEQAIELDADYALAHAGLSDAYVLLASYDGGAKTDAIGKARTAAADAIRLDESLADAHAALGTILLNFDHDFAAAERAYSRAIELNPNNASVRNVYGQLLSQVGRHEDAIGQIRCALELDPLSLIARWVLGSCLFLAREYAAAADELRSAIAAEPDFALAHYPLAAVHMATGSLAECINELEKYQELRGEADAARAIRSAFETEGWNGALRVLVGGDIHFDTPWHNAAVFHVALDEPDDAFRELSKAVDDRDQYVLMLRVDPRLDPLRADARFDEILAKAEMK